MQTDVDELMGENDDYVKLQGEGDPIVNDVPEPHGRNENRDENDENPGGENPEGVQVNEGENLRYPKRNRKPPSHLDDFVTEVNHTVDYCYNMTMCLMSLQNLYQNKGCKNA